MTALAKCKDCKAITLDTEEDARGHREWHRDFDAKFRNTRTAAVEARDALGSLRAEIKDLREEWDQAPEPIEPDQLVVNDMRDDDELGLEDPEPEQVSQYTDDEEADDPADIDDTDEVADEPNLAETQPLGRDPLREYFAPPRS